MIYLCDICLSSESVTLVTLEGGCEKYLALKLIQNKNKHIVQRELKSCKLCFKKLQIFKYSIIYKLKLGLTEKQLNSSIMHYPNYPSAKDEEHYPNYPPAKDEETFQNQYFDVPSLNLPPAKDEEENQQPFFDLKTNPQSNEYFLPHIKVTQPQSNEYLFPPPKTTISPSSEYMLPQQISTIGQYNMLPLPSQSSVEINQPEKTCTDDYNCQCDSCQNKYGDLPILLQGIEQKTFNDKTDPQPSTSSQSSSSKRMFTCEYCKKTFTHKGDFNKHLRKHTKEKPFSCKICSRKFGHTSNLLRHQRLHSGEKPFACDNCDKRFSRKDKLDCHKRSRTCQEAGTSYY